MVVAKTFDVDLVRLEVPPTWACMQGDANSRAICYRLYADGLSYEIPSGVSLRIAYEKADKTSGVYSQLPDGSSAYEISGNTVTIRLIEDISAKSGMALVQPILYDSDNVVITVNVHQTFQIVATTYGVTLSNTTSVIKRGSSYECTVTPTSGYNAVTITVRQGSSTGTDVTNKYVSGNKINIPSVTFNVYITANGYTLSNYDVVNNLTNCTTSNNATTVEADASYTATVTHSPDYALKTLTVKMGGTDITNDVVTYSTNKYNVPTYVSASIKIPKVTGKVEITGIGAHQYNMLGTKSGCSLYRESGTISGWTGVVWEGANYNALYKPSSEYTRVSITVKKGSSSGTDVTSSVVGKTTFNGVSYDSVTIYNVKDNYYINARGTT